MNAVREPVRIRSIGIHLPTARASNYEKAEKLGFERDFLENKLGIVARSVMEPGETTSDLAVHAFHALAQQTEVPCGDIQLLVVVTQHPDFKVPHTAALVHNRLALAKDCMTFDISQGCAGYTHAVTVVTGVMDTANLDHAVLITSDPYSDKVAEDDRDVSLLFGDAATATYFSRSGAGYRLIDSNFGTLPDSYRCLMFRDRLEMDGGAVFKHAVQEAPPSMKILLDRNQLSVEDVDLFLLHQGSKYLVEYVSRKMRVPPDRAPFEASHYGNTVSSSIPLMLQKHLVAPRLERIVLSGFGVGFTWGNNLLQLTRAER
ncbi:MAG: ketoacyl-ACP synthase III [Planctomycetaceae bacterium]|nr:ketoacyl-ACP synthase III [Planctomycetaceae bacterium]